jgi:tetratricopeptide (TPR) repeat protein
MKGFAFLALVACILPILAGAQQQVSCEPVGMHPALKEAGDRMRQRLKEKKFSSIEDELSDKLRRQEAGSYSDVTLHDTVAYATKGDTGLEPLLAEWVRQSPNSFVAHLSKGAHHVNMGFLKRGSGVSADTSAEQIAAMELEFSKAVSELKIAMELRPSSVLPYPLLMRVAAASGQTQAMRGLLAEAQRLSPGTVAARQQAIFYLTPKWGGTFEELDALAASLPGSALTEPRRRRVLYFVEMAKADHYQTVTKERTKEIDRYRQALQWCSDEVAWNMMEQAAYSIEDWKTVVEANTQLIAQGSRLGSALQRRGWAHENLGDMQNAIQDYAAAADTGETWAQAKLGYLLMVGTQVPKDLPRARKLFEAAAAKGNASARSNLERLANQSGTN